MEVFNILKPDMIRNKEALNFYFDYMLNRFGIDIKKMYYIQDWVSISKKIYELDACDSNLLSQDIIEKRKKLLITILGYYLYYKNQQAIISLYSVDIEKPNILNQLRSFKKELRNRYVLNTDRYYLRILNLSEINLELPLKLIDLQNIETETIIVPSSEYFDNPNYDMVFFNKIHFPDPNIETVQKELKILRENDLFNEESFVRRLTK